MWLVAGAVDGVSSAGADSSGVGAAGTTPGSASSTRLSTKSCRVEKRRSDCQTGQHDHGRQHDEYSRPPTQPHAADANVARASAGHP